MEQNNDDLVKLPDLTRDEHALLLLMLEYAKAAAGERGDLDNASMSALVVKFLQGPNRCQMRQPQRAMETRPELIVKEDIVNTYRVQTVLCTDRKRIDTHGFALAPDGPVQLERELHAIDREGALMNHAEYVDWLKAFPWPGPLRKGATT